jgi:nicotinate-nucleotide pyrophosphorylase (carboxylating)
MACERKLEHLLPVTWQDTVHKWLQTDIPSFDVGGFVVGEEERTAVLLGKSPGILAGVPFVQAVFDKLGCTVEWLMKEGDTITPVCQVAKVTGPVRKILMGERTALNIITRASGIATQARSVSDLVKASGWAGEVAGTRKTTPGFRMVEKYALLVGGCSTHRHDLSAMVMLKDNHIWSAGNITNAVKAARSVGGFSIKIEVECRSLDEAKEACTAGADICMLDNYTPENLHKDATALKKLFPHVIVEGSGGITKDTIVSYCSPAVDVLSMGSLTQGYFALDFSLKVARGDGVAATSVTPGAGAGAAATS